MHTIETTAVLEDSTHLRLADPVSETVAGPLRVILVFPDDPASSAAVWPAGYLDAAYGSCRDDPLELPAELLFESNRPPLTP